MGGSHDPIPVGPPRGNRLLSLNSPTSFRLFIYSADLSLARALLRLDVRSFPSLTRPMPTPNDNQPNSIAEVISTRTCPEVDRVPGWSDSPDTAGSASDTVDDDVLSPENAIAPSVLSRSDDGSALLASDGLKVESKMPGTDEDAATGRSVSPADACDRTRSTVTPPNSSLLRYEFSNVRVRNDPFAGIAPQQLTRATASAKPFLILSALWQQICWNAAIGPPGV